MLALQPEIAFEKIPDNIFVRIIRPIIAKLLRVSRDKRHLDPIPLDQGVYGSKVVALLEGTPAAYGIRKMLDAFWDSPVLTKQSKALIVAVVAKIIGCKSCETEACQLLQIEGIGEDEIEKILTYLDSPALNSFDSDLIAFVRETVHYRPVQIQEKCREFSNKVDRAEFLEVVGLSALANSITRLSVLFCL